MEILKYLYFQLQIEIHLTCNQLVAYYISMDKLFKALADGTRRELLDILFAHNGQTLGELCAQMTITRQAVTKHLLLLEEANLITVIWQGREKLHYLNPVPIGDIYHRWISKFDRHRIEALQTLKQALEEDSTHD